MNAARKPKRGPWEGLPNPGATCNSRHVLLSAPRSSRIRRTGRRPCSVRCRPKFARQNAAIDSRSPSVLQCSHAPLARQDRGGRDVRRRVCVEFQGWPHSAPAHRFGAQGGRQEYRLSLATIELGDRARAAGRKYVTAELAETTGIGCGQRLAVCSRGRVSSA